MTESATCPHCNRAYSISSVATHAHFCPERADIYAANLRIMTHPTREGYAVSLRTYRATQPGTGATSHRILVAYYGSWVLACQRYGLKPLTAGRPARDRAGGLNAPLTDAERHACTRRGMIEAAATGGVHSALRSVASW